MGNKAGKGGSGDGPKPSKAERKAQRSAKATARGPRPGLLDRATRLVLALFVLAAVAQHTLPGAG